MRGVFDDLEPQAVEPKRDAELTLGAGTLLAIFLCLLLLCGLCFGVGYEVGRGNMPSVVRLSPTAVAKSTGVPKPSAAASLPVPSEQDAASAENAEKTPSGILSSPSAQPEDRPQVQAALPVVSASANAARPRAQNVSVQSARIASGAAMEMVEVAALADPNDAEYLLNALKKHGYPVLARRDSGDNRIHVRVGPFTARDEANRWRQRLTSDGYSAVVIP